MTSLAESSYYASPYGFSVDEPDVGLWRVYWRTNSSGYEYIIQTTYQKFDGLIQRYYVQTVNETTQELLNYFDVIRIDQGLSWGHDTGDRFDFHVNLTSPAGTEDEYDEDFYMTINSVPVSIYPIDDIFDLPFIDADFFWANGTAEPSLESFFLYAFRPAFPIGNWTVFTELFENYSLFETVSADDTDPYFWELTWYIVDGNARIEVTTEVLKVDGVVSHLHVRAYNVTNDDLMLALTIDRLGLEVYRDRISPVLTHPADIEFTVGAIGQNITWTANDENPASYEVYLNGALNATGAWTADGEYFIHSLDGYEAGVYNLTIMMTDIAGNTAVDQVVVTVNEASGIPDFITDNLLYIAIGLGAVIIVGAVVCLRRR
ncbi:MAG: hypothetical protein RTU30_11940, partial [Candidatus Thorarchaeota archaeon]